MRSRTAPIDWKALSREACSTHEREGASVVFPYGEVPLDEGGLAMVDRSPIHLVVEGAALSPRVLRRFWWEHRTARVMGRDDLVLWTTYHEGKSYAGMGALVRTQVADRMGNQVLKVEVV